jgi:hypothetical protein
MGKKKVTLKPARTKAPNDDPEYIGLRLRGLARLVFHASNDSANADPINQDAAFFISTELEDMAVLLGA